MEIYFFKTRKKKISEYKHPYPVTNPTLNLTKCCWFCKWEMCLWQGVWERDNLTGNSPVATKIKGTPKLLTWSMKCAKCEKKQQIPQENSYFTVLLQELNLYTCFWHHFLYLTQWYFPSCPYGIFLFLRTNLDNNDPVKCVLHGWYLSYNL